ncbi:MAG: HPP family protein [Magnetovibrio sp.]|nr:HPP family protein [Magnetovibrio sp.]
MADKRSKRHTHSPRPPTSDIVRGLVGAFIGIAAIASAVQFYLNDADLTLVIGAFGATAVLIYGVPSSPFAQPYNVLLGHMISAAIGVTVFQIVGEANWLSAALAVSLAVVAMQLTRSVHPPGGASALIAVVASAELHELGYLYVLYPVGLGAAILVAVALAINNIRASQRWPSFWY